MSECSLLKIIAMAIIIYMVPGAIYSQEKDTVHNSREYTFEESVNQFDIEKAKKYIVIFSAMGVLALTTVPQLLLFNLRLDTCNVVLYVPTILHSGEQSSPLPFIVTVWVTTPFSEVSVLLKFKEFAKFVKVSVICCVGFTVHPVSTDVVFVDEVVYGIFKLPFLVIVCT